MAVKLSFDERKWLLRCYWKVENVVEAQQRWSVEFGTPPPTRITITRIREKFEVEGTVQDVLKGRCGRKRSSTDNESADAVMQVLHDLQRSQWGNVLVRLVSRNPVFIEFCELKNGSLTFRDLSMFDVVVVSVLWQKVDILNMYGLKEVYGIEHNTNCISVSFRCWEITFQKVYTSIWIWYTSTNKGNNNKNPRQVWIRWNGARCVEREVPLITIVLMQSCRFCTIPKEVIEAMFSWDWHREIQCSSNFASSKMEALHSETCRSVRRRRWECTVAEGGHFVNMYGFKE